jgi:IrrE N-terminal-like domain
VTEAQAPEQRYRDARAHELRARYLRVFGGREIPVPVESIAEDLCGLRIETAELDCSGMLLPAQRLIRLSEVELPRNEQPLRRYRFTIAHELGHWICHALEGAESTPTFCRATDMSEVADRRVEREANVFAAELLMPEVDVRAAWQKAGGIDECAAHFDVSPTAMRWRLFSFGLVGEPRG